MLSIGRQVSAPKTGKETQPNKQVGPRKDATRWPSLYAFLYQERDLGQPHKTGSITIFTEGGKLKAVLNDRPIRKSVFLAADSFAELWAKADMGLEAGTFDWSGAGYKSRSKRKVFA